MGEAVHDNAEHAGHPGHVVPLRILVGTLAVLMLLTVATVAVTWVDLGSLNILVALGIAVLKASLVALYFMHLRWDRPFNAVVLIFSLVLLALFVGLSLLDSLQYQPDVIPGYSPDMQR